MAFAREMESRMRANSHKSGWKPSEEKKAAIRYLWLRDANNWTETGIVVCSGNGEDTIYGEALDKALDAEILAASPQSETPK
jgi:hypothetical protein